MAQLGQPVLEIFIFFSSCFLVFVVAQPALKSPKPALKWAKPAPKCPNPELKKETNQKDKARQSAETGT